MTTPRRLRRPQADEVRHLLLSLRSARRQRTYYAHGKRAAERDRDELRLERDALQEALDDAERIAQILELQEPKHYVAVRQPPTIMLPTFPPKRMEDQ